MNKYFRILSIDGGGIRGIIPAQVLVRLEKKLQVKTGIEDARIADYFDLIAGTSTGGILTCIYLCPDHTGKKPKFTAEQAVEFYCKYGAKIFKSRWVDFPKRNVLRYPKYSSSNIEVLLKDHVGDTKLNELLKPCLITAYDIEARATVFFAQRDVQKQKKDGNYYVRDVARATSAAPTFFPPALIKSDKGKALPLIDGGVFANNPSMCAFAEVRQQFEKKAADTVMLSLGTGKYYKSYPHKESQNWGGWQWVEPLIDIMMSGVSETIDYQMNQLYESVKCSNDDSIEQKCDNDDSTEHPKQYLRVNANLPESSEMDDASEKNIKKLVQLGTEVADEYSSELDDFVKLLLAQTCVGTALNSR